MAKNYYEILELPPSASAEEIKKSFRRLALKYHPDKNPGNPAAEQHFKEITAAYSLLSDPFKKRDYDRIHFSSSVAKKTPPRRPQTAATKTKPSPTSVGKTLIYHLSLTLEEAFSGCEKTISYVRHVHGKRATSHLTVSIPPGVREDKKLRIRGAGEASSPNQAPGDLVVQVHILPHKHFHLDGDDILLKMPLSALDFLLGDPFVVPTLHGPVPVKDLQLDDFGVASLQLENKGFPRSESSSLFGDQFVRFVVDTSSALNENQKEKLRQIKKVLPKSLWQKEIEQLLEIKK